MKTRLPGDRHSKTIPPATKRSRRNRSSANGRSISISSLLLALPLVLFAFAAIANALPPLTASAPTNTGAPASAKTTLTGVAISGGDPDQTLRVSVATDLGTLSLPSSPTGLTLAEGFSSWQDQSEIAFVGLRSDVNAALANLSLEPGDNAGQHANVSINAQEFNPAMVYSPTNGHYYEYIASASISYDNAKAAAAQRSFGGHSGYIATIPSEEINTLIAERIPDADNVWFGGEATNSSDEEAPVQRDWHWAAGPLAGETFLQCSNWTGECTAVNGPWSLQSIWADGEPNNDPWETAAVTNWNGASGRWNDLETTNAGMVQGFIVEYGDLADGVSFPFSGTASASASIPITDVSAPPTEVTAEVPVDSNTATVSWTAPSNASGIPAVTGYTVTSSPGGLTCSAAGDASSCQITDLTWGTNYTFTVTAENEIGLSVASTESNIVLPLGPPSAPTMVSATASDTSVTIDWDPPASDGGTSITDYYVEVDPGGLACTATAPNTECMATGLTPGVEVQFRVKAFNQNPIPGSIVSPWSDWSDPVTPVTVPNEPENVEATTQHNTAVVSWTAPAGTGGLPLTNYTVTASPGGASCTAIAPLTTCLVEGLEYGTEYTFAVTASNSYGTGDPSISSPVTPEMSPPGPPTNVQASLLNPTSALLSWDPPTDHGGGAVTYEVTSEPAGLACNTSATSCVLEGIVPGTTYVFTVRARNAAGSNDASVAHSPSLATLDPLIATVSIGRTQVRPRNARGKMLTRMFKPRRGKDARGRDNIKVRGGTTMTVTSNRAAMMTVSLQQRVDGAGSTPRWARASAKLPKLKIKSGTSLWRFSARSEVTPLAPGKYRMSFRLIDAEGNVANPQSIEFTVLARRLR